MTQNNILSFWRNVEIFNLPDLDKDCTLLDISTPFPWVTKRPVTKPNNVWRYTLYFGKIPKKAVIQAIEQALAIDVPKQDWEEPIQGSTCFSALLLDDNGTPDHKSYVPAGYVFGIDAVKKGDPISKVAEKLIEAQEEFEPRFNIAPIPEPELEVKVDNAEPNEEVVTKEPIRKGETITLQHLEKEIKYLNGLTDNWNSTPIEVYILAKEVPKDSEPDTSFLNSFFLDDLNFLADSAHSNYGKSLDDYLKTEVNTKDRKDLIADKDLLFQTIDPILIPAGRWPSNPSYGLYTAQLGAVNTTLNELKNDAGLRGINGPPGTGKTTLLLDVIADIIVTRSTKIIDVDSGKLFTNQHHKIEKENSTFTHYCYKVNKGIFSDSGIVIASNNNNAVENITKELPAKEKIDGLTFTEADYFAESASRLIVNESWGILSAALGKGQNRSDFRRNFWESDAKTKHIGFKDLLYNVYRDENTEVQASYKLSFEETKSELKQLLKDFQTFKERASKFHNQLSSFRKNCEKQIDLETILSNYAAELKRLKLEENGFLKEIQGLDELITQNQTTLALHNNNKPAFFFFKKLFGTPSYKDWKKDADFYFATLKQYQTEKTKLVKELNSLKKLIKINETEQSEKKEQLDAVLTKIKAYHKLKTDLQTTYGIEFKDLVDDKFYNLTNHEIHLRTPYSSHTVNKLRSNIFLKSLDLHKYAILCNAKKFKNNLDLFFEMLSGRATVKHEIAELLWDTFFFCVPAVSTTLASVSRLFTSHGKGDIGWLLIDEAGQATPQSAAGIIWRSKRCIIVGDPLQVEPVVTIPQQLVYKLREQEKVDKIWSPHSTSVQVLADRVSKYGTYMNNGASEDKIWTGFPLRTHRRCDNPMFDIANKIAYSDQMVKATPDKDNHIYIGKSKWFHVADVNPPTNKHVLKAEIDLLHQKIDELIRNGYEGEIFVISPFSSVANACISEFRSRKNIACGTIHKFQGKEAEVVFLILGGNPKSPGARLWASQKPNMLNVALTRAKKRFYVIGNKKLWGSCQFFDHMAAMLG
ncbi:superfamily I DNA and/or RNA helicase [Pedobacter africanus]|uniref:Superfamily I DNA and/or RNA helicase n=1 Tax=Pedobacter africanus TaxID=151894 RepID=A0ACC6KRN9_9SPHI|nr:ATP-binding protein [Pedobacter africanus]MDR6781924.1 superfamily I DNA and/or RNA helicase [Pedobacter africanus]